MNYKKAVEDSIVSKGNLKRIAAVMQKAMRKEEITIGFIGGSITMGSLSSTPKCCYAYLVYEWWTKTFSECKVNYVNAGIGATTSQFGVARVEEDLLDYKPDLVLVEFSVNDRDEDLYKETYEGLIRRILLHDDVAVMILNNVQYNDGVNAERVHNEVGRYYNLPMVSVKKGLYPYIESKVIDVRDLTPDDLHPNDKGHELVSKIVIHLLENIRCDVLKDHYEKEYIVPKSPLTKNRYMDSKRLNNKNVTPVLEGFERDESKQHHITEVFKNGWSAGKKGDSIQFQVKGGIISLQYKKTVREDAPIAHVVVDGDEENLVVLDANFLETWGDCLYLQDIIISDDRKPHTLTIRIIKENALQEVEFYLASIILANIECD